MNSSPEKTCPRCGSAKMKRWNDLAEEEQMLALKLPLSAEYRHGERKKHRFCTRCWFEDAEKRTANA